MALPASPARRLRGWFPAALPRVVLDAPEEGRQRRDRVVDVVTTLVAFAIGFAALVDSWEEHPGWLRPVAVAGGLAALVALRWRRRHPTAVGVGLAALSLVVLTASGANLVALFNAAIRSPGRGLAAVAALMVAWSVVNPLLYPPDIDYWADAGASLLLAAVAVGWGLFVRARRALVASLRTQSDRAAEEARAAERQRIAREMHDVLAHRLSLLSVHAGALEFHADAPPEHVAAAAGVIRESARAALEDLRGVVGVLRDDTADRLLQPPPPTAADLPALLEESRAAGMRVRARLALGDVPLTAAVGRTAYRIVQEGLTNARKHAPGAAVTLEVEADAGAVRLELRSLASVAVPAGPALPGAGTGLVGLAERVSLAGGELQHGIDPDGAFVLRARLPR